LVKYKEIDGIYCIILDEDIEEEIHQYRVWRRNNDLNFLKNIENIDSLKEALEKVKEDLEDK